MMMNKKNFCILPWIHLHVMPNSNVFPCCYSSTYATNIGKLSENTLENLANSELMKQIRLKMIKDQQVDICSECINIENRGSDSPRMIYNRENKSIINDIINDTNEDGSINNFKLRHLHFRHSNLCNYACRTCGPEYSSTHNKNKVIRINEKVTNYLSQLDEHLPYVTSISLTGGESLLLDENFYILDKLIEIGNTNVKIDFVTNLSKLYYKNKSIIDYIKIFGENNVTFIGSIDAIGARAELLRYGCQWDTVENNIKTLVSNNVKLFINCTLSVYNIWHGIDIEKFFIRNGYTDLTRINLFPVANPNYLDIRILPIDYKKEITDKIQTYLNERGPINKISHLKNDWGDIVEYMNSDNKSLLLPNFFNHIKRMDNERNESTFDIFPELLKIKQYQVE